MEQTTVAGQLGKWSNSHQIQLANNVFDGKYFLGIQFIIHSHTDRQTFVFELSESRLQRAKKIVLHTYTELPVARHNCLAPATKNYSGVVKFQSRQVMKKIKKKIALYFVQRVRRFQNAYRNQQMLKTRTFLYATITIPAKGPAYFRRVSCQNICLRFCAVIGTFLFEQNLCKQPKQTWRATGFRVSLRVRTHNTTTSHTIL